MVIAARHSVDLCHIVFHDIRKHAVGCIVGLAHLEVDVRVLNRGADQRMFRVQRMRTERIQRIIVEHAAQVFIIHLTDLVDLVGGPESVKEVHERNSSADGREVRDRGQVHDFLHTARAQHGKPGLAAIHDVGMVAENRQGMRADRTRRHMQNARVTLSGNAVHDRDHQHQALG